MDVYCEHRGYKVLEFIEQLPHGTRAPPKTTYSHSAGRGGWQVKIYSTSVPVAIPAINEETARRLLAEFIAQIDGTARNKGSTSTPARRPLGMSRTTTTGSQNEKVSRGSPARTRPGERGSTETP